MKKFLLSFLCLFLLGRYSFGQQLTGACGVSNVLIQNVRPGDASLTPTGSCDVLFDVSFTMGANNGNKTVYIASYIGSVNSRPDGAPIANPNRYPDHFKCQEGNIGTEKKTPKTATEVGDPLLLLVIDNETRSGTATYLNTYTPEPNAYNNSQITVPKTAPSVTLLSTGEYAYVLKDVPLRLPNPCGTATYTFITDVFATQSASANQAHCVNCGIRTGALLTANATLNCNIITGSITNNSSTSQTVSYSYWVDMDGDGVLNFALDRQLPESTATITISASGNTPLAPYTVPDAYRGQEVFIVLNVGGTQRAQLLPSNSCSPLPVKLKSFNARRNGQTVALGWTTATESDNKGFNVQRKINGDWETVAFVKSKAQGGNSTADISYTYNDVNAHKGVSQYRLKQEDHNGKTSLSEIRSVRGEEMAARALVYPNPSTEGGVNVVFDNARGDRDVLVSDMSGRVIKQWRSVTDNSMRISNLQPGTYTLRIVNKQDGSQQYEKLVINR